MTSDNITGFDFPPFLKDGDPLCAQTDPDAFFPDAPLEGSLMPTRTRYSFEREAKQICGACEHKVECLAYAMGKPDLIGIWGGSTEKDRSKIRRGIPVTLRIPPSRNR